jgi:hypothetical protein
MIVSIIAVPLVSKQHGWLFGQVSDSSPLAKANYRGLPSKTWSKPVGLVKKKQLSRIHRSPRKRVVHGFGGQCSNHPHDRSIRGIEGAALGVCAFEGPVRFPWATGSAVGVFQRNLIAS